ncbi:MAG: LysR substrate-binding domain-containing protein [Myxococcota bacterium]
MSFSNLDRDLLRHLPVVLAVARRGGFAAAASELSMSASAVSHAVRVVEKRLGSPLFARTTRRVGLTDTGEDFVAAVGAAFDDIDRQLERAKNAASSAGVVGNLRLNVPRVALAWLMTPLLAALRAGHPDLRVEVFADDGWTDIIEQGFDAGVRLGQMVHADMVAIRLTPPIRAGIVASPAYVSRRGLPQRLTDLPAHDCIDYRLMSAGAVYRWELVDGDEERAVEVGGPFIVNDYTYAIDLARRGFGLAYVFLPVCEADLAAGRLVRVLAEADIEEPGLFVYFPKRTARTPKIKALIQAARQVASSIPS